MANLSTMDATFLYNETPETPMHVAGLAIFKPRDDYDGNIFEDYRKFIADRVHLISYLHRRLSTSAFAPFDPIWIEDYDLDWDYHIRHNALPKPGNRKQLNELVERLHAVPLDRKRPLWQFYVIEGLEEGGFALFTKTHHACLDGGAGIVTMNILYDQSPDGSEVAPPNLHGQTRQPEPDWVQHLRESYSQLLKQQVKMLENAPQMLKAMEQLTHKAVDDILHPKVPKTAPRTPINVSIGRERSFSTLSLPLSEVKALAKATGYKINDVVMMLSGGALRRYLERLGDLPAEPLIGGVPASLRKAGDFKMNNQVVLMLASLATTERDPIERLKAVSESMTEAKERLALVKDVIHLEYSYIGAPQIMQGWTRFMNATHAADQLPPPMNVIVSNVPGAPSPWYLLGHEMANYFPVSIPNNGVGLNITAQSYRDTLDIGIVSGKAAVQQTDTISEMFLQEYALFKKRVAAMEAPTDKAETPAVEVPIRKAPSKNAATKARTSDPALQKTAAKKSGAKNPAVKPKATRKSAPRQPATKPKKA
ncbi:WS/DGAT/MGAT family O-acyltransferase [Shimia biformata]|uniref:WS/DGAT/MGAT family O-acyltransferase n=1 Tax=Shimia biformata TaxID=1294299 RepID=UPI0019510E9F|nr:wax ester/triacylglycerol synthase family O-acyltransferase [Shimia biformata]